MKNLLQRTVLSGMVGLAGLVSGCSTPIFEKSKTNSEPQKGLVKYEFLCKPKVELSSGEVKMKFILRARRDITAYPSFRGREDYNENGLTIFQ